MNRLWAALGILVTCEGAYAIESKDAAYYCVTEAVAGLSLDKPSQKWQSTHFRPTEKFILKFKHIRSTKERMFPTSEPDVVNYFNITITKSGSNTEAKCFNQNYNEPVRVWGDGYVFCSASLTDYKFNPGNNRFLSAYLIGYIDGDQMTDTPAVSGGTCTKID